MNRYGAQLDDALVPGYIGGMYYCLGMQLSSTLSCGSMTAVEGARNCSSPPSLEGVEGDPRLCRPRSYSTRAEFAKQCRANDIVFWTTAAPCTTRSRTTISRCAVTCARRSPTTHLTDARYARVACTKKKRRVVRGVFCYLGLNQAGTGLLKPCRRRRATKPNRPRPASIIA